MMADYLSSEQSNFMKVSTMLVDCGSKVLRKRIETIALPDLTSYFFSKQSEIIKMKLPDYQKDLIFPKSGNIDLSKWDISLLSRLLLSPDVFDSLLQSDRKVVHNLRTIRNSNFGHTASLEMDNDTHDQVCVNIEKNLHDLVTSIDIEEFSKEVQDNIQAIRSGIFDIGSALASVKIITAWSVYDNEALQQLNTTTHDIKKMQMEDRPGLQKMMSQLSEIHAHMLPEITRTVRHGRQSSASIVDEEPTLQLCEDLDFVTDNLHPFLQYHRSCGVAGLFCDSSTSDARSLTKYPGTTGTTIFDQSMTQYFPVCLYRHSHRISIGSLLAEICFCKYKKDASFLEMRQSLATVKIQIYISDSHDVQLSCTKDGRVDTKTVSRLLLVNSGFRVEFGFYVNGPRSKLTVLDSHREEVVFEVPSFDLSSRHVLLFGLFGESARLYLYVRPQLPDTCREVCDSAVTLRDDISFDRSTIHPNIELLRIIDGVYMFLDPLSEPTSTVQRPSTAFRKYLGARTTLQLHKQSIAFFMCHITVRETVSLPSVDGVLAEVSLCPFGEASEWERVGGQENSIVIQLCMTNRDARIQILHGTSQLITTRAPGYWQLTSNVIFIGILVDGPSNEVHIIDWERDCLVHTVRDVNFTEPLHPVFGAFREDVRILLFNRPIIPKICNTL